MSWATMEPQEFYTLDEVTKILRISERSIRQIIRARRMAHYQPTPGGRILVRHADLMEYLERMRVDVQPETEPRHGNARREKNCG